jgi:hypothetical protein
MTEIMEEAKEIARQQGHKDVDEVIVCTDGARVPVWMFYLGAAEAVLDAVSTTGEPQT